MTAKVLTITLNTAYDLVGRLSKIERGEVNTVETLGLFPAGKGINVAKVLHDLGVNVAVGGFLGAENQGEFEQLFAKLGLEDKFQRVPGKTRINVKITETEDDVTDLNFLGYQISEQDWAKFCENSVAFCQQFDIVAVCGSLPQGVAPESFAEWLEQLHQAGVKVVLDSSNAALSAGLKAKPWLVKPNHRELEAWIGKPLNSLQEIIDAGKQLQAQAIPNVIVSMGANGSIWLSDHGVVQAEPPKCDNVVSTVGAGDSMVAGLIYGIENGLSQAETLKFASAVSAFAVRQSNVGVPDKTALEPILAQVKITQLEKPMKLFLIINNEIGAAKSYLLRQHLEKLAKIGGHLLCENAQTAEFVLVVGENLPNSAELAGKKVSLLSAESLMEAENPFHFARETAQDYVAPTGAVKNPGVSTVKNIVAVTACPTGVAHTFMSAEAIETYAKAQGWQVKVETRGQVGAGNEITPDEIAAADLVFVAADIDVPLDKFAGKPMYRTSTGLALKKTAQEFEKAFAEAKIYQGGAAQSAAKGEESGEKKGIYKHLMTGVSHMLPLVVAGGLLIAISFMFGFDAFKDPDLFYGLPKALMDIGGGAAFHLMIAVFAGFVAFSIADRPGLAVGLIGGMLATTANAGILGGIIAGFLAGYTVKGLNHLIKLPASLTSLKPILILPLFGSAIVGLLMVYFINPPVAQIMAALSEWLQSLGEVNALVLGAIIGAMMCVDMGGPVNKAAYTFSVGMLASQVHTPMAAAMAAGMVPPIGMAIATWIARNKFTPNQRDAGKASFVLGLCFISEGALPFVAADPIRVIISSVIGGAVAGAMSMGLGIELRAPHGGVFVTPFVSEPLLYLGAIATGALLTGVIYALIKTKPAQ